MIVFLHTQALLDMMTPSIGAIVASYAILFLCVAGAVGAAVAAIVCIVRRRKKRQQNPAGSDDSSASGQGSEAARQDGRSDPAE